MTVETVDTHRVQDATKIKAFMKCPRFYFYSYVLGWRPEEPSIHLVFGSAWHEAMEYLMLHGLSAESIEGAYSLFETEYRKTYDPSMDLLNEPKTPANALRALVLYARNYKNDHLDFEVLHTEVAGSVLIGDDPLFFKIDTVVRDKVTGRISSLEHKTTTSFSSFWLHQWRQNFQVGTYTYALRTWYSNENVDGVIINGAMIKPPPRVKLNGELYANSRDCEFQRVPARMNETKVNDWVSQAAYWLAYIKAEFEALASCHPDDDVMRAFPKVTESCTQYGKPCPYIDFCVSQPNPLRYGNEVPIGMAVEHWDPREAQETANEVLELKGEQNG